MSVQRVVYVGIIALCAASSSVSVVAAQSDSTAQSQTWYTGGSLGVPVVDGDFFPNIFTIALHQTSVESGHIGPDLSIGTSPVVLVSRVIGVGARANLALAVPVSEDVFLLPGAGLSFLGWVVDGDADGFIGGNLGLSTIFLGESSDGGHIGVTWHRFSGIDESAWHLEVGFVRAR